MNFINRSLKYICRRKTRTIILSIMFFLIGNLIFVALGVWQASDNAKTLTRQKMNAVVSYKPDYDSYAWLEQKVPKFELELAERMAADERVRITNETITREIYAGDFNPVKLPAGNEGDEDSSSVQTFTTNLAGNEDFKEPDITVYANKYKDWIQFDNGTWELIDGNMFSDKDIADKNKTALIEEALAEENGLSVGDTIKLRFMDESEMKEMGLSEEECTAEFTIAGIYRSISDAEAWWQANYKANKILVPSTAIEDILLNIMAVENAYNGLSTDNLTSADLYDSANYILTDPLDLDGFVRDYEDNIEEGYVLDKNDKDFKTYAKPLDTISLFAKILVASVIISSIVITVLVTSLTLRERSYEIGVLLSMGVQRWKITAQLFLEVAFIVIAVFGMACLSGSAVAGKIGEEVLNLTAVSEQQNDNNDDSVIIFNGEDQDSYASDISQEDLLDEYQVTISVQLIVQVCLTGLAIVFISILIPAFMILRYNPKRILMSNN